MRIDGGDDVQQARDNDETGAVVAGGDGNLIGAQTGGAADQVEQAVAEIAGQAEHVKNVFCARVELALHGDADGEHAHDGCGKQSAAAPLAQQKMARAGHQPACDQREIHKPASLVLFLVLGICHALLTISHEGSGIRG